MIASDPATNQSGSSDIPARAADKAGPSQKAFDWLFGYDYFIAHRSVDGKKYASALFDKLTTKGNELDCFLDVKHYGAGGGLTNMQARALRKTTRLIVVVTPRAHDSDAPYLRGEVAEFRRIHPNGIIVPIGNWETLTEEHYPNSQLLPILPHLPDDICILESDERFAETEPSAQTVAKLLNDFSEERRSTKRLRWIRRVAVLLFILFVAAAVLGIYAEFQRRQAKHQTKVAVEAASRGNVSLARYSKESGKNAQALAQLGQALRLNPKNEEASGLTAVMLTRLTWNVPLAGSMKHEDEVYSAQFSPNGQRVVTASADNTARLWDATSGKPVGEPMKHESQVRSAQFSPDGQRVVTASWDSTARVWDATSGKPVGEPMKHEYPVWSAQFSPNGQRVVTASADSTARLWDATSGKPVGEPLEHENEVLSAQFSPNSQRVVTASADKTARLWDAVSLTYNGTKEDILLLAELAKATAAVSWETVGQRENLKFLAPEQVIESREKIAAKFLGLASKLTPLQRFLKWSVSDRRSRTISPFSQLTFSGWLENRIDEGTVEGLRTAMQVDPTNARVTAHLGRRLANQALEQGVDLDEARRARGEADFLTNRAVKLTPDNEEVKKLRDEVVKLLELKTN